VDVSEIESFVDDLVAQKTDFIRSKGMAAIGPLMGPVMAQFRGKADGKLINKIVTEKIRAVLES
ncbi:MAG: GatB/YqeY domain-containing protein, partial [Methanosarcinaceae archaeon]|nr:GatB/YqeY domain-containing protein [Methanosarcinaceae archaeon]